ncbi:MAG: hypothetical protein PHX58_10205 [Desulfovibrio sp.]|jgi:hypothetical protein|nr:hypothetical protein [Desulfovibrio sp.]
MRKGIITLFLLASLAFGGQAFAHTPLCDCFDNGDGTVSCEGGFSDGSSASGVGMTVKDGSGNVLTQGSMNEYSEFTFDKPEGDYQVVFDAGEGHSVVVNGSDIVE